MTESILVLVLKSVKFSYFTNKTKQNNVDDNLNHMRQHWIF